MLCVEVFVAAPSGIAAVRAAIALGLVTAAVLVTGHPETMFFMFAAAGGYGAVRVVAERRESLTARAARVGMAAAVALAGLALTAVQVLPFLEYWRRSSAFELRTHQDPVFLSTHFLVLNTCFHG